MKSRNTVIRTARNAIAAAICMAALNPALAGALGPMVDDCSDPNKNRFVIEAVALGIDLFKRFLDEPSKVVRYITDASYWLCLFRLPILIWLQIAFAELPFHWSLKLIAISLLTVGISLFSTISWHASR